MAQIDRGPEDDVLRQLRTHTAAEHEDVEQSLDLMSPGIRTARLAEVLTRLHGFWLAAEAGLDDWAARFPADADTVGWAGRRRAALFAGDVIALGAVPEPTVRPDLPALAGTDEALGRLYVLEGSTLGGRFIDGHLAALPGLSGVRLRSFTPYGDRTGAMWAGFRRATRERVAGGGDAAAVVAAAQGTFGALATWVRPAVPA